MGNHSIEKIIISSDCRNLLLVLSSKEVLIVDSFTLVTRQRFFLKVMDLDIQFLKYDSDLARPLCHKILARKFELKSKPGVDKNEFFKGSGKQASKQYSIYSKHNFDADSFVDSMLSTENRYILVFKSSPLKLSVCMVFQ